MSSLLCAIQFELCNELLKTIDNTEMSIRLWVLNPRWIIESAAVIVVVVLTQHATNIALTHKSSLYKLRFGQIRHTY
jgi:hypothetical protein